jgi:hypothetical protein
LEASECVELVSGSSKFASNETRSFMVDELRESEFIFL